MLDGFRWLCVPPFIGYLAGLDALGIVCKYGFQYSRWMHHNIFYGN